ncbi:hypothetical protein EOD23_24660 [Mesorhizobium sp. USDA-HM6]|nr:hypothetical protein EOD23_24660 [Mesorhizobium sp. USDA-HM6]
MFPFKQVIVLQVFLNFEIEDCQRELTNLRKALGRGHQPCMHDKRHIGFVLMTNEEPNELLERLRPVLEVDRITNYTATLVLGKAAGKYGGLNSLVTQINAAFNILNGGPAKYLRDSQTVIVPDFRKSAPREMGIEGRRNR